MNRIDTLNMNITPAAAPVATGSALAGEDFSTVLAESMTRTLSESALAGAGGMAPLLPDDSFGYLQSMLLSGAADNQASGDELLMFMFMYMMQEFKNSDLTPLMTALAAYLPGNAAGALSPGFLPEQAWLPISTLSASAAGKRSAEALNTVISQFNVENAARYRPQRAGNTYCNIFVWDVTRALGCEIPHYVDQKSGDARYYPDIKGAYELDANGVSDWLRKRGADYGWREISAAAAQHYANAGYPVVSAWRNNGGGAGHVQMVCPSRGGGYDPIRGVTVAQAGSRNFTYAHINATMSADKIAQTRYYTHN